MMYASGRGVDKDEVEAVRWFRRAAEKGHPYAMQELQKRDSQTRPVDLEQSVKSYVVVSGFYTTPAKIRDECSKRYPSLTELAKRTTDDYVVRNKVSFERVTKQINLMIENYKDGKEKQDAQLMMTVLKPMLDQKTTEAIQPLLESIQKCEGVLEKISSKEMDIEKVASDQIAKLNQ
jgi:TPR repeat protein